MTFPRDCGLLFTPVNVLFVDFLWRLSVVTVVVCFAAVIVVTAVVLSLVPAEAFDSRPGSSINYVVPMSRRPRGQFDVSFDQQDASIANFSATMFF